MKQVNRILVPVDLSECSRQALEAAAYLGRMLGARIEVLHVFSPPGLPADFPTGVSAYQQWARIDVEKELGALVARYIHNTDILGKVVEGDPVEVIIEEAEKGAHDLIALGTHGNTGLLGRLLGSVAAGVVKRSRIPVLTVPEVSR